MFAFLFANNIYAQALNQTIKGKVLDADIRVLLQGATLILLGTDPLIGTVTDIDGNCWIENFPVGRFDVQVNYIGYKPNIVRELIVGLVKELIL